MDNNAVLNRTFREVFAKQLKDLPRSAVITIDGSRTVSHAVKKLNTAGIQSAPVIDWTSSELDPWVMRFVGVLDQAILARWIMRKAREEGKVEAGASYLELVEGKSFDIPVISMWKHITFDPLPPLEGDTSLFDALEYLHSTHSRRFCITRPSDMFKLTHYITHTTVASELVAAIDHFVGTSDAASRLALKVSKIRVPWSRDVVVCGLDEMVCEAFDRMIEKKISGLAVVNSEGELTNHLSASDIHLLVRQPSLYVKMYSRTLTVEGFVRLRDMVGVGRHLALVSSKENLEEVLRYMVSNKIHRVYCVDGRNGPAGVATLTDCIGALLHSCHHV